MTNLRLFVAIKPPDEVIEGIVHLLRELQQAITPTGLRVRWVNREQVHLTLKFLGGMQEELVPTLSAALREAVCSQPPFRLRMTGAGAFPNLERPRIIWLGISDDDMLLGKLAAKVEDAVEPLGFAREQRDFRSHLTLGRIKSRPRPGVRQALERFTGGRREASMKPGEWQAEEVVLFRSELKPTGAVYTAIDRFPFGGQQSSNRGTIGRE